MSHDLTMLVPKNIYEHDKVRGPSKDSVGSYPKL